MQIKGQEKNQLNEMINSSINSYVSWKNDLVKRKILQSDTTLHYISKNGLPTGFSYDNTNNIIFLNLDNLCTATNSFLKELRNGIPVYFLGLKLTDNRFILTVSSHNVKLTKKRNLEISLSDWSIFTYEYSCEEKNWKITEVTHEGI